VSARVGTRYDVTDWPVGDPSNDVGEVINSIISDVKLRQSGTAEGPRPGAVIMIPPGDFPLRTTVLIDVSFLRVEGQGHGFTSSSIRFNTPADQWRTLHELWPGGSRILVDLPDGGAAFRVERRGNPRISSVEFSGFCIDGLHFVDDGASGNPENSYANGLTGIHVASANDSFRITGMGMLYLERGLVVENADAVSIHDNFIAECGSCIELRGWGQASKVTDNLIGAGPRGPSILAEHHGGLLVAANNVFPRGASSVHLRGVTRSSVTANRLHSFYPGMIVLDEGSSENLVASNHVLRDLEPWAPFQGIGNGRDDLFGLVRVEGDRNSIIGNHISAVIDASVVRPSGESPVAICLAAGIENYVAANHVVALDAAVAPGASAYEAQVDALLSVGGAKSLPISTVLVGTASTQNTIIDSGRDDQVVVDRLANAVRVNPTVGS
jgi:hypothetical protein